jgi:hypothetical protein
VKCESLEKLAGAPREREKNGRNGIVVKTLYLLAENLLTVVQCAEMWFIAFSGKCYAVKPA